ncbi:MAG: HAD family phosphatase [Oscillospiraceae bacterium]|jgi:HAD superfamily hydrolase (TIGR01509 family)|nr:HAD family phosphatase [Oscillospiraceae bacterium]
MRIKGAIFDMDGTLLDSMPIYETVIPDLLAELGYAPAPKWRDAVRQLSGIDVLECVREMHGARESAAELEALLDRKLVEYYTHTPQPKPGVRELLETLGSRGIPMVVATATNRVSVEPALRRVGFGQYFKRLYICREEDAPKSEPEIFLRAARFLGAEPSEVCVFEDALHAVKSAKRGGFYVVAVRDLAEERHREEIRALADEYYDDLSDFDAAKLL